jgi:hypothetical protein
MDLARQHDPPGIPGPTPTRYFYNLDSQLDSIVRADSTAIRFGHDAAGRTGSVTFDRGTLTFGYSPTSGNLVGMRAPTGDSLTFNYDGSVPTEVRWVGSMPTASINGPLPQSFWDWSRCGEPLPPDLWPTSTSTIWVWPVTTSQKSA